MPEKITLLGKKFNTIYTYRYADEDEKYNIGEDIISFNYQDEGIIITLNAGRSGINKFSYCLYATLKDYVLFKEELDAKHNATIKDSPGSFINIKIEKDRIFCQLNMTRKIYNCREKRCYVEGIILTDWHELKEL